MMLPRPAALVLQHAGQRGLDRPVLRAHVQVQREVPFLVGRLQHRAVVDEAGAVEQHVDRRHGVDHARDRLLVQDVEGHATHARHALEAVQQLGVDVGRPDLRAFRGQRQRAGAPDSLSGRRHQRRLALQSHCTSSRVGNIPMQGAARGVDSNWPDHLSSQERGRINPMPLQAVEPNRLYRQIAEQLRGLIAGGEFVAGPGCRRNATWPSSWAWRPSVREALIALEVEGLVEVRTGSGIYVLPPARPPRRRGQSAGGRLGAAGTDARARTGGRRGGRSGRAQRTARADRPDRRARADDGDVAAGMVPRESDQAFHLAIASACRQRSAVRHGAGLVGRAARHPVHPPGRLLREPGPPGTTPWPNTGALEAMRSHSPVAARAAMQLHLGKAYLQDTARAGAAPIDPDAQHEPEPI